MRTDSENKSPNRSNLLPLLAKILLIIGVSWLYYQYHQIGAWKSTNATVLSVEAFTSSDPQGGRSTTYSPTVRYMDSDGKSYTRKPGYRSAQFNFDRGEVIPIAYDPDSPGVFRITTFVSYWAMPLIAFVFGVLLVYFTRSKQDEVSKSTTL